MELATEVSGLLTKRISTIWYYHPHLARESLTMESADKFIAKLLKCVSNLIFGVE